METVSNYIYKMHKSTAKRIKLSSVVTPCNSYDTKKEKTILVKLCKENIRLRTDIVKLGEICF